MFKQAVRYKSIFIDCRGVASNIEHRFAQYLKPAPAGLYYEGCLEPVIVNIPNIRYTQMDRGQMVGLDDIMTAPKAIVYLNEKPVITSRMLTAGPMAWSAQPTLPYTGIKVILKCMDEYISDIVTHHEIDPQDNLWSLLRSDDEIISTSLQCGLPDFPVASILSWIETSGLSSKEIATCLGERIVMSIRRSARSMYDKVSMFVGPHVNNTYEICYGQSGIFIHQGEDWRAMLWERDRLTKELEVQA